MVSVTTYLPIWRDKLKKAKDSISKQLEEAKANGGKTAELRARLKNELRIAKSMKRAIKEIENEITKILECPCCKCKFKINSQDNGNQCLTIVADEKLHERNTTETDSQAHLPTNNA